MIELPVDTASEQVIPETRKGSWFGSISRKRKRQDVAQPMLETLITQEPRNTVPEVESTGPPQSAHNAIPAGNDDPQSAPPPARSDLVEPQMRISLDDVPSSWPTTSPQLTEPQNARGVLSKPAYLDVLSPTISISSVDDVVPQLKSSSAALTPVPSQNPMPTTVGGVGDITTGMAGTTTSRFTLRIPLLGRPKIPLNQAVSVTQNEDIRNLAPVSPISNGSTAHLSVSVAEEVQRPSVTAVPSNTSAW